MKLYIKLASLLLSLGAVTGQTLPLGPQPLPTVETTSTGGQSPTVTAEMKWDGVSGRTYFVQKSTNFESWSYVIMGTPEVPIYHFSGIGAELTFPIPSPGDGTHYRLAYLDVPNYDVMTADSDNDGITDQDEIDAGTDALNGAIYPIGGVSPLEVTLVPVNDTTGISGWEMKWKSSPETNYTIQRANDLSNWVSISQTILGDGSVKSYLIPLNEISGWHYRLAYTQVDNSVSADTDGDGLSDLWEELNQLNPYSRDTNGNGIDDGDEVNEQAGVSQASVYQSFESGSSDNLLPDPYPHLERGVIMFYKESKGSQRGKSAAFRQFYEGQLPQKPKYYLKKFSEVTVDYSHGLEGLIGSPFGIGTISEKFDRIKNEKEVEYTGDGEAMRFVSASYVSDVKKETIIESGGYDDPPNEQDEDDEIETVTSKVDLSEEYTMAMVKSDVEYDIAKNPWVKTVVNHAPLENLAGVQEVDLYRNESYVSFINKIKMFWAPGTPEEKKYPVLFLQGYTPQGTSYAENENATELIGPEGEIKVLGKWDGKGAFSQTFVIDPFPEKNGDYRANSLALDLAVDANRDGEITTSDQTTSTEPYRFWINNDTDNEEDTEDPATTADSSNNTISTQRDLEDFTRVWFNIGGLHDQLKSGDAKLGFKWTDASGGPSIKLYWAADADGSRSYLTDEGAAAAQIGGNYGTALGTISGGNTTFIDKKVFANIDSSDGWVYFLYEGVSEGSGKLTSVLEISGTESEAASVDLKLLSVRKMYVRGKGVGDVEDPSSYITNQPPDPNITYFSDPWNDPFDQDPAEEEKAIVVVHGWRMTYNGAQKYGETFFKRLWHRGFKGRYGFFRWPTLSETTHPFLDGLTTYNESEYKAWKSGGALKSFVETFPSNYSKDVCAHSMGNIVIGSALKKGLSPRKAIFMQAAISASCYDDSAALRQQNFLDAETIGSTLPPLPPRRTPDHHTDGGYRNYLSAVGGELINFYNFEDSALKVWDANNLTFKPNWLKGYRSPAFGNDGPGRHAWPNDIPLFWRDVTDQDESMAYCARSRTLALGRTSTFKKLSENEDLDASFGFVDEHSAQFVWRMQKLTEFYNTFLEALDIANIDE